MVAIVPRWFNYSQDLDKVFIDRWMESRSEGDFKVNFDSSISGMTLCTCRLKITHVDKSDNDGIIELDSQGFMPIGMHESKYGRFQGSILGSKVNSVFAQALKYIHQSSEYRKYMKFIWLSNDKTFTVILLDKNMELIKALYKFYDTHKVTPCKAYETPGIDEIFKEHPLNIERSFVINKDFKVSELLCYTLNSVGIPAEIRNGFDN